MRSAWLLPDASATQALGAALGRHCPWGTRAPRCVFLRGELGAGKTTLAAALLAAAGVHESVLSPTYALIEIYPVHAGTAVHVDLYRLRGPEELEQLGLRDQLQANTLLVLEWPEHGAPALPTPDLMVSLQVSPQVSPEVSPQTSPQMSPQVSPQVADSGRTCHIEAFSPAGQAWLALLEHELPPSDPL